MVKKRVLSEGESLEKGIVALCGERGHCPVIDFTNPNKVVMKDGLGGRFQITREQWEDMKERFSPNSPKQSRHRR